MQIPLIDLKAQYLNIKKEIDDAVGSVLRTGAFILGEDVSKLEEEVARFCGVSYGVGVNSGTDALYLSLRACGVKAGDEVITTSFSFFATAETISMCGAVPVFIDIDPITYNIDVKKIEEKINAKTKAIIPVHLFGQIAEMEKITDIAKRYNLKVIEDACQAIGSEYKGKKSCTFGDTGCLSFFPTKNLGGIGDGGMVVTNNKEIADRVRMLRVHGSEKKYMHSEIGIGSRLDTIQAAVLRVKLKYLQAWNEKRIKNAKIYNAGLKKVGTPVKMEYNKHIYHQYTIRTPDRDKLQKHLTEKGISSAIHYPVPLHKQEVYVKSGINVSLPESENASKEVLSLPCYPEMTEEMLHYVIGTINGF